MSVWQILRIIWARKWIVLGLFLVALAVGAAFTSKMPRQYTAQASLVVDVKADPILGAMAPGLATPAYMATQVEILKSDRVSTRVVKMLGLDKAPNAVAQWREATEGKVPVERYFGDLLQRGFAVEPSRGSNVINLIYGAQDPAFAAAAVNAFAQAYMDVSLEMRIEPARQSAAWFDAQTKSLRADLEQAQTKLSQYQQQKGIVISDERMDQETTKLATLSNQLAQAEADRVLSNTRVRNSGTELSPDVQQSGSVQSLKSQIASAEAKLSEISSMVGVNHPQRVALVAQIRGLQQQLAAEVRRVSGGSAVVGRASAQTVEELRALMEQQKRQVLSLRAERDQIAVLQRDVEAAKRSYDLAVSRAGQFNLESKISDGNVRVLSPAVEPLAPSKPRVLVNVMGAAFSGLVLGVLVAFALEWRDRRVRGIEDLAVVLGVPVIGVLRPANSRAPVFRRLAAGGRGPQPPQLMAPRGMQP